MFVFEGMDPEILEWFDYAKIKERDIKKFVLTDFGVVGIVQRYWFFPALFLFVKEDYRRKGYARELLKRFFAENDVNCFLTVPSEKEWLQKLYSDFGFVFVSKWRKIRGVPMELMARQSSRA